MGRNHIGARQVDIFRYTGISGQLRRSFPQPNVVIYGVTPEQDTLETDPKWKIWRVYTLGGIEYTTFAAEEKYINKWSDHLTLFPVVPTDPPPPIADGIPFHGWNRVSTTPGAFTTVLTFGVPVTTRVIKIAGITCCMSGVWELDFGGTVVASGATAPGKPDSIRIFDPRISAASAVVVSLRFKARSGSPIVDVDGFIDASDY